MFVDVRLERPKILGGGKNKGGKRVPVPRSHRINELVNAFIRFLSIFFFFEKLSKNTFSFFCTTIILFF